MEYHLGRPHQVNQITEEIESGETATIYCDRSSGAGAAKSSHCHAQFTKCPAEMGARGHGQLMRRVDFDPEAGLVRPSPSAITPVERVGTGVLHYWTRIGVQ